MKRPHWSGFCPRIAVAMMSAEEKQIISFLIKRIKSRREAERKKKESQRKAENN